MFLLTRRTGLRIWPYSRGRGTTFSDSSTAASTPPDWAAAMILRASLTVLSAISGRTSAWVSFSSLMISLVWVAFSSPWLRASLTTSAASSSRLMALRMMDFESPVFSAVTAAKELSSCSSISFFSCRASPLGSSEERSTLLASGFSCS